MIQSICLIVGCLLLASQAARSPPTINRAHRHLVDSLQRRSAALPNAPAKQWFTQTLDHFNAQDNRQWKQRFYVNDTFFNPGLGGPIFFQVGGEGAISPAYVTDLQMVYYAQQMGALCVALEHRFYGESHPFPDMDVKNLQYLSSQQALSDAAVFISHIKSQYPMAGDVVTFGGSYPGALAAWFRVKFPHLTKASIASSAPVQATFDMVSYLEVVDRSLDKLGGVACDANIRKASAQVDQLLQTASGRAQLSKMFHTCTPIPAASGDDTATFLSSIIGNFMGVVQYDREIPNNPTIKTLCGEMEKPGRAPLASYVAVSELFRNKAKAKCLDISYSAMITQLRNVTAWGVTGVGERQWTYQTCQEFGFYQTTDGPASAQPFGTGVPLSYYEQMCRDAFGITTVPRIAFTNEFYGGAKPLGATRIVFVNGNVDPWSSLSVLKDLSPTLTAVEVDGGAHCSNMFHWHQGMNPNVRTAQSKIAATIQTYLNSGPL